MSDVYEYLKPALPKDHARQSQSTDLVRELKASGWSARNILDLGCGAGNSLDFFRRVYPSAIWTGVDIEKSPEVAERTRADGRFLTFDGTNIPVENESVHLLYSHQVFEHVRHPEILLPDVARVLAKDGFFIGQTSHLEPFHSYSYWNFTVWGWKRICEDAGIEIIKFRPGIDGLTLSQRTYLGRPKSYSKWFSEESPYNEEIERSARSEGKSVAATNFRKLMHCGVFSFVGRKSL